MLEIKVDKRDLVELINSCKVQDKYLNDPILNKFGGYIEGFVNDWIWDKMELKKLNERQLYKIFKILKNDPNNC